MKKLLIRLKKEIKDEEGNILKIIPQEKRIINTNQDLHTKLYKIPKEMLQKESFELNKHSYIVLELTEHEKINSFKRGAQIISPKDAGIIITKTGINKNTHVLDAGAGTGSLAATLSLFCKVTTIEKLESHIKTAKKNLEEYKNVKLIKGDIYEIDLKEKFDVMTLDVPDPQKALKTAKKHIKKGGFLVTYCPQITQSKKVIEKLPKEFLHFETIEMIQRNWKITKKLTRPQTSDFQHTAFLSFFRKIK
ncbi:MAG: methyltransferase domain-containing protein [Candidatus Woesearchaeota archaeon]